MRLFFAGFSAAIPKSHLPQYLAMLEARGSKIRELSSYIECSRGHTWRQLQMTQPHRCEFFLDSGAYSAWAKGTEINLQQYAQFVLDRPGTFDIVANLDVIPGAWGQVPTQQDIDVSAKKGWENYSELERLLKPIGKKPMHIYHQGEDGQGGSKLSSRPWLKKLMDNCEYFGVSPGNDRTTRQKMEWLDEIMPLLVDDNGMPTHKFHGFGVTSLELLYRYPWYSADSTSWVLSGRFGSVFIPLGGYEEQYVKKVTFSDQSPKMAEPDSEHFKTFAPRQQEVIREYLDSIKIKDEEGKELHALTPELLASDYIARDQANIIFFLDLEKALPPDKPWKPSAIQPTFNLF